MTNNERFNAALNSCQNPQTVYDALLMLMKANDRELDLVWRILRGMLGGKEAQTQTEGSATQ